MAYELLASCPEDRLPFQVSERGGKPKKVLIFLLEVVVQILIEAYETSVLTLSLPRVINVKFPLQLHQKYYITQYGELGFS